MKFIKAQDYLKDGMLILTFPTFKLHVDKFKNERELYVTNKVSIEQKNELDSLFRDKLSFIQYLLNEIGINYYALVKKESQICLIATAKIRPERYTIVVFRFFGYLTDSTNSSMVNKVYEWTESYQRINYKIRISSDDTDEKKAILQIEFREKENKTCR